MRHRVKGRKLSRKKAHRQQTLRDLSNALIREHRIVTTLAKAKALRPFFEPLVTRAKEDTQHNRRQVFSKLNNKHTVSKLFNEIGPKAEGRPGGYTRIVRYGYRKGDGAEMAIIELVDYNDIKPEQEQTKQKKTRRAGRKKKTTSAQPQSQQESTDEASEEAESAEDEKQQQEGSAQADTDDAASDEKDADEEKETDSEQQQDKAEDTSTTADESASETDEKSSEEKEEEDDDEEDKKQ